MGHVLAILFAIALLTSAMLLTSQAYGKNTDNVNSHQPPIRKYQVYLEPSSFEYSNLNSSLAGALAFWEKSDNVSFRYVSESQAPSFTVRGIMESDGPYSAYTINGREIEVGLGDSRCGGVWHEYDSKFVLSLLEHEVGHAIGHGHSRNPSSVMYPFVSNASYKPLNQTLTVKPNKSIVVTACTFSTNPSFHYKVSSSKGDLFDVYFVKSDTQPRNMMAENAAYHSETGCHEIRPESHEGICKNADSNSALIIVPRSELSTSMTVSAFVEEIH
ncbi:MAG TPA: matrixin family metalloprotease [Candidatus Nitrosotalea sp.]|nr:matrixin family metalloprotease [Candidatus Nitrosotalea sp.]